MHKGVSLIHILGMCSFHALKLVIVSKGVKVDGERACDSRFVPRLSPIFVAVFGGRMLFLLAERANMECLQVGRQHVVYLMTYSRADVVKVPSKESFSNAVLQAWQNFGVGVLQWVTCIEAHYNTDSAENGENMSLYYYDMAIKLEKRVCCFEV